ncbi:hypothetical protein JCM8097_000706 [Rhodosporidiobolus ruineniae]
MGTLAPPLRRLSYLSTAILASAASSSSAHPLPQPPLLAPDSLAQPFKDTDGHLSAPPARPRRASLKRRRSDNGDDGDGSISRLAPSSRALDGRGTPARRLSISPDLSAGAPTRLSSRNPSLTSPSPTPRSAAIPPPSPLFRTFTPLRRPCPSSTFPLPAHAHPSRPARGGAMHARSFLTFRTARKPALAATEGSAGAAQPPPLPTAAPTPAYSNFVGGEVGEKAAGGLFGGEAGARGLATATADAGGREGAAGGAGGAGEPAAALPPRPKRREMAPPRPPSPYGEINALVRHPTLYDPVLKPRFPIVLCHGLYGFDVRGPGFFRLHYWGDLLKILRGKIGAEVFVTAVPGTGSVKNRAQVLHKALEDTPALLNRDLNFVAHSMGGLDARYLISNIRPNLYRPRSLTTICTPHRGSEFMAWCRANIGIGTEFDQNEALDLRPSVSSSLDDPDDASIPLPYSLKSPILSREQVEAGKRAVEAEKTAQKVKAAASSLLPFNLSVSVTSYLLDLLDSPAYANLTPSFLRDAFNPSTPNREDVKYYSIAARTDKIPIWHPLWLPKLVLDGAEAARVAQGVAAPPEWRGNDGLVSLDSARWGEFLGTFDHCDHWEARGSSGLSSAEASKAAVEEMSRSEIRDTKEPKEGEKAEKVAGAKKDDKGWQWQDVYASVANLVSLGDKGDKKPKEEEKPAPPSSSSSPPAPAPPVEQQKPPADPTHDEQGLASAASWIIRQLPGTSVGSEVSSAAKGSSPSPSSALSAAASSVSSAASSAASTAASSASSAAHTVVDNVVNNRATRLLYGAPGLSSSAPSAEVDKQQQHQQQPSPSSYKPEKGEKFSLERMTIALCRKLHNDGF